MDGSGEKKSRLAQLSIPRITHGDRALAEYASDHTDERWDMLDLSQDDHIGELLVTAMFAFDVYPLPDGLTNTSSSVMSILPSFEIFNNSMNRHLHNILDEQDLWLLEIPRLAAPGRACPDLLTSPSGGAALLLPMAAFGTLFRWNEQIVATKLQIARGEKTTKFLPGSGRFWRRGRVLARLDSYLFTGGRLPWVITERDVSKFLLEAREWRKTHDGISNRERIWAYTIFQQSLMILHEFGHIKSTNDGTEIDGVTPQDRLANEMSADKNIANWLCRLSDDLMGSGSEGRYLASEALWSYFMILGIVNEVNQGPISPRELNVRILYLLADLGTLSSYGVGDPRFTIRLSHLMEKIYFIVGGRQRDDFVAHERACYAKSRNPHRMGWRDQLDLAPVPDVILAGRYSMNLLL